MEICQEDGGGDNPYWLILCKVPKDQRVRIMECIDLLPGVMENAGMKGYVNYCQRYIRFYEVSSGEESRRESQRMVMLRPGEAVRSNS